MLEHNTEIWQTQLEFALFRVFGIAKGSPLLVQTGEFVQRTQKRYDDGYTIGDLGASR